MIYCIGRKMIIYTCLTTSVERFAYTFKSVRYFTYTWCSNYWYLRTKSPNLSQLELHKQDFSDVPIKSNQASINRENRGERARDWSNKHNPSRLKSGIQVIVHINAGIGWLPIMLKPHFVTNDNQHLSVIL